MMRSRNFSVVILAVLLVFVLNSCGAPWTNPGDSFRDDDLVGTWRASYPGGGVDLLIMAANTTFQQEYRDGVQKAYVFKSPTDKWWTERLPDGLLRLHLQGARYYEIGIEFAEQNGRGWCSSTEVDCRRDQEPYPFYDPFAHATVYMLDELVLEIRQTSRGELILHHLSTNVDGGFALIGGESDIYQRVADPKR